MAQQNDSGISVDVPGSDDEDYEDSVDLAMDQEQDVGDEGLALQLDEDEERNKYGLNSPKRPEEEGNNVTPATKFRQEAGINSPKQQKKMDWGNAAEDKLAGLVTQVKRDDAAQTGFDDDGDAGAEEKKPQSTQQQEPQPSGGMCACLSSLFSCCSNSSTQTQTATQVSNQQQRTDPGPKPTKDRPPETDKTELLDAGEQQVHDDHAESESSSTEYVGALLPPLLPEHKGKKCLVLDLDETLVHSSFKPISTADFIIPVEIDNVVHRVYVMKRPFVDEFLVECAKYYEVVIFTASLSKYADPLLDQLDTHHTIAHRLFRESCVLHAQAYVKDLRRLGRKLKDTIIVDNSPQSYLFQPKNAVPIASWFDDQSDTQLRDFLPVLRTTMNNIRDVRWLLNASEKSFRWLCQQADQPLSRYRKQ